MAAGASPMTWCWWFSPAGSAATVVLSAHRHINCGACDKRITSPLQSELKYVSEITEILYWRVCLKFKRWDVGHNPGGTFLFMGVTRVNNSSSFGELRIRVTRPRSAPPGPAALRAPRPHTGHFEYLSNAFIALSLSISDDIVITASLWRQHTSVARYALDLITKRYLSASAARGVLGAPTLT